MEREKLYFRFRFPKTSQEMRAYYRYPYLVRAKRRPVYLPDSFNDDIFVNTQKSWKWKKKKKRQWG